MPNVTFWVEANQSTFNSSLHHCIAVEVSHFLYILIRFQGQLQIKLRQEKKPLFFKKNLMMLVCFWVYISICVQMNEMWGAILARHNHQHQPDNHLLFVFISRHFIAHIFGMKRKTLSLFQRKMEIWWEKEQKNFFHILIYTFEDPFQKIAFILSSLLQAQSTHLKLKVVRIDDKKWIDKCSTRDSRIESETCEKCKIKPNPHQSCYLHS